MKYTVRVTDGHSYCDIEIDTNKGLEEACSLAMERAKENERTGDLCCWEPFESRGQAEYVDSVSAEDNPLDVPVEYRCWTERSLLQEIAELKGEIIRLKRAMLLSSRCGEAEPRSLSQPHWKIEG